MKPLIEHLEELRTRIIVVIVFLGACFIAGVLLTQPILAELRRKFVGAGASLIVLTPIEYFIVQLKIGLYLGIIVATPLMVYELMQFVKPAIQKNKILRSIIPVFIVLYFAGLAFAYFLFMPLTMKYITPFAPSAGIANIWSLNALVNFLFITIYSTALIFEIPLIMLTFVKLNLANSKWFSSQRKYIYVAITILAAIITPGVDIVTQILVMIPMILLFEFGILLLWVFRY
ncbi:MAG: twin-arginine translocase subunit TatC [Candidatus Woesearchaeota archaeon]